MIPLGTRPSAQSYRGAKNITGGAWAQSHPLSISKNKEWKVVVSIAEGEDKTEGLIQAEFMYMKMLFHQIQCIP